MGLADDLEAAAPVIAGDRCHACDRLTEVEGRDRQFLDRALHEKTSPTRYAWSAKAVWHAATRNGLLLPEADIHTHRNGGHGA